MSDLLKAKLVHELPYFGMTEQHNSWTTARLGVLSQLPEWSPAPSAVAEELAFQKAFYQIRNKKPKQPHQKPQTPKNQPPQPDRWQKKKKKKKGCPHHTSSPDCQLYFLSKSTKHQLTHQAHPGNQFWQTDSVRVQSLDFSTLQAAEPKPQTSWNSLICSVSIHLHKERNQTSPLQPTQHNPSTNILQPPFFPRRWQLFWRKTQVMSLCYLRKRKQFLSKKMRISLLDNK